MQNWELSKAITRKLSEISNNFIKTICLILLTCIRNSYQKFINCLCFGSNDNDNDCYKSTSWKPTLINLITYVNYDFSRKSKQISTKNPCEIRKRCIYDTLIVPTEAGTPRQGALKPPQMTLQSLWLAVVIECLMQHSRTPALGQLVNGVTSWNQARYTRYTTCVYVGVTLVCVCGYVCVCLGSYGGFAMSQSQHSHNWPDPDRVSFRIHLQENTR